EINQKSENIISNEESKLDIPDEINKNFKNELIERLKNNYDSFDTSRLAVSIYYGGLNIEEWFTYKAQNYVDYSYGTQFFHDNPTAYMLADIISKYFYRTDFILNDFDYIKNITSEEDISKVMILAASRSPYLVDQPSENHILKYIFDDINNNDTNKEIDQVFYTEDIEKVIYYMFGDENEYIAKIDKDIDNTIWTPCYYYPYAEVLIRSGNPGGITRDPHIQIEHYEEIDVGYICNVYFYYKDVGEIYIGYDDKVIEEVTKENFERFAPHFAKYRFTFKYHEDGRMTLSELKTLYLP
ncbi:MAG: hypothetical protein LBD23_17820, partial [Oscillospiraceae bacterium]|nr:hypothetical protein [Oscillospiraceae bacterium]